MRLPSLRASLIAAGVLALAMLLCVLMLDRPIAAWLDAHAPALVPLSRAFTDTLTMLVLPGLPKWVHPLVIAGVGVVVAIASLYSLPRGARGVGKTPLAWLQPFLLTAGVLLATRLTVGGLKAVFHRVRPFEYLADPSLADFFVAGHDSFPSGHTAVYAGLFLPPALLLRRLRGPLLVLLAFCALARVAEADHYLGDVLASTLIALLYSLLLGRLLGLRTAARA